MIPDFKLTTNINSMTKSEMWKALSGKTVKCIYVENKGSEDIDCCLLAVQDVDSLQVYILDMMPIE